MASYSSFFFHIPQLPHTAPPAAAHLRSFLSLDIADSVVSRRSSTASDSSTFSFFDESRRSRTPTRDAPSRASSSASSASSRALPSPKPAPSARIPAVPAPRRATRSQDAPRRARPRSPAPPLPVRAPRPASIMTGTSAASTHYRVAKRTDALARLEGRTPRAVSPPLHSPAAAVHRTKSAAPVLATHSFMPFSAEDSDSDGYDDDDGGAGDVRVELVPSRRAKKGRSRAGTIESWFVGPPPMPASAPPAPKNFMDFDEHDAPKRRPYALI